MKEIMFTLRENLHMNDNRKSILNLADFVTGGRYSEEESRFLVLLRDNIISALTHRGVTTGSGSHKQADISGMDTSDSFNDGKEKVYSYSITIPLSADVYMFLDNMTETTEEITDLIKKATLNGEFFSLAGIQKYDTEDEDTEGEYVIDARFQDPRQNHSDFTGYVAFDFSVSKEQKFDPTREQLRAMQVTLDNQQKMIDKLIGDTKDKKEEDK